jgi:hypothetical protein
VRVDDSRLITYFRTESGLAGWLYATSSDGGSSWSATEKFDLGIGFESVPLAVGRTGGNQVTAMWGDRNTYELYAAQTSLDSLWNNPAALKDHARSKLYTGLESSRVANFGYPKFIQLGDDTSQILWGVYDGDGDSTTDQVTNVYIGSMSASPQQTPIAPYGPYHYAEDGSELDAVLNRASPGDKIYLGKSLFSDNRTISTRGLTFVGPGDTFGSDKCSITGAWTIGKREVGFEGLTIEGDMAVNVERVTLDSCSILSTITVDGEEFRCFGCYGAGSGAVVFTSTTSGGIVDASSALSVTDNSGSNTIGDLG